MIQSTTLIEDVKEMFEGGSSLAVSWDSLIRRAVTQVMEKVRPATLLRRRAIYAGLAQDISTYYAPTDVHTPAFLYPNDGLAIESQNKRKFTYVPPAHYYRKLNDDVFTLQYINGARFVIAKHALSQTRTTIDAMTAVGTKTGGTPTLNEHNYLEGGASIEATFTSAGVEFGDTLTTALDISDFLKGAVTLPCFIPTADNLTSLEIRLKTDDSNYHRLITTADDIEDYIIDGWNMLNFEMATRTEVGTPTDTNITEWSIIGTTTEDMTIIFDKFAIQKFAPHYLDYYSRNAYATSAGVLWQTTIENANSDQINFEDDLANVLLYELAILVEHSSSFKPKADFRQQLAFSYEAYNQNHPSMQAPISYSKSPEIDISQDVDFVARQDDTVALDD